MDIFSRADVCIEGTGHTSTTKIGVVFTSVFPLQPTVPLVVEKMPDELQPISSYGSWRKAVEQRAMKTLRRMDERFAVSDVESSAGEQPSECAVIDELMSILDEKSPSIRSTILQVLDGLVSGLFYRPNIEEEAPAFSQTYFEYRDARPAEPRKAKACAIMMISLLGSQVSARCIVAKRCTRLVY